ncbi:24423_t:CDS:1, partial [Gigaspora rosea]
IHLEKHQRNKVLKEQSASVNEVSTNEVSTNELSTNEVFTTNEEISTDKAITVHKEHLR